jgi:hypothetical protein
MGLFRTELEYTRHNGDLDGYLNGDLEFRIILNDIYICGIWMNCNDITATSLRRH